VSSLQTTNDAPVAHIAGWDSIEFWVGNARTTVAFLCSSLGFEVTAYRGPETGSADEVSYVLKQGDIRFVITAGLRSDSPIWDHVRKHGDGVHDLAFLVDDADATYAAAMSRGATSAREPYDLNDGLGKIRLAAITTFGDTQHTFVDRSRYSGPFAPGYSDESLPPTPAMAPVGLTAIDHVVACLDDNQLEPWVRFYEDVLGFAQLLHYDESQITTEYSALRSTVVWNGSNVIIPLNEPAEGLRKSQVKEYVDVYNGPGIQHLALQTADIVTATTAMKASGLRFLEPPAEYYDDVSARHAHLDIEWDDMERLGILVDSESEGHLLQIFSEPMTDRPALFFETIQRCGANGFGEGNFKALFEAYEQGQQRRGNL